MLTPFLVYLVDTWGTTVRQLCVYWFETWKGGEFGISVNYVNLKYRKSELTKGDWTVESEYDGDQYRAYPEDVALGELSELVYQDEPEPPEGWECLMTAENEKDGYFGAVFWKKKERQLVVAHRGTNSWKHAMADVEGVMGNCETSQMSSAASLVEEVVQMSRGKKIHLSLTGHSLGGWLAQVTCFTARHLTKAEGSNHFVTVEGDGVLAHALAIDSPGAHDILVKMRDFYFSRHQPTTDLNFEKLDLNVCLSFPNLVNTFSRHPGYLYSFDQPDRNDSSSTTHDVINNTPLRHYISSILRLMRQQRPKRVLNWPTYITPDKSKNESIASYLMKCLANPVNITGEVTFQEPTSRSLKMFSEREANFLAYIKNTEDMIETNLKKFLKENYDHEIPEFEILAPDRISSPQFDRLVGYVRNLYLQYPQVLENMIKLKSKTEDLYNERLEKNKTDLIAKFVYLGDIFDEIKEIKFKEFINSDSSMLILRTNTSSKLESLRVLNSLSKHSRFLTLKQLGELRKEIDIINILKRNNIKEDKLLLIECFENDAGGDKILEAIKRDIKKIMKKIIIIKPKEESVETNIAGCVDISEPKWDDIKMERKIDILGMEIKFQGEAKTLNDLDYFLRGAEIFNKMAITELENILTVGTLSIGCRQFSFQEFGPINNYYEKLNMDHLYNILNVKTNINILVNEKLELLIDKRIIKISGSLEEHIQELDPDKTYFYVEKETENLEKQNGVYILRNIYDPLCYEPRKFKVRSRQMDSGNLKTLKTIVEAIVVETNDKIDEELENIIRGNYEDYQKMTKNTQIVHFIKKVEDRLLWQESRGNITTLKRFLKSPEFECYTEKEFTEKMIREEKQVIILADEPGMGKSTTLSHLINHLKSGDEMRWVIKLCLKDYEADVKNINSIEGAIGLLTKVEGGEEPLHSYLLGQSLQAEKGPIKIFLLFDGFDDVTDKDKVLSSLLFFRDNTRAQIWVTTRKCCQEQLEDLLCELAVHLEPFQETEEAKVLESLLINRFAYKGDRNIYESIAKELLTKLRSRDDKIKHLLGVPLLIRILAEVYSVEDNLNMFQLFEAFFESKFTSYIKSSYGTFKLKETHENWIKKRLSEACYKLSQRDANEKLSEDEIQELCSLGLVHKTTSSNFIHETISEFFYAQFLHDNLTLSHSIENNFLNQCFLNQDYKVIRLFLNDICESNKKGERMPFGYESPEFFEKWSKNRMDFINKRGQTGLHLLVEEGLDRLLEEVVGPGCPTSFITVKDRNDLTFLNFALNSNKHDLIRSIISIVEEREDLQEVLAAALLRSIADKDLVLFMCGIIGFNEYPKTENVLKNILPLFEKLDPLFQSAPLGALEKTKMILEGVQDQVLVKYLLMAKHGKKGNTMLHLAVEKNQVEMVRYLLEKGAPVDERNRDQRANLQHQSPLHIAAKKDYLEIARELCQHEASVDLADRSGHTPFLRAIMCNSVQLFDFLLGRADLTARDGCQANAFMWAARRGNVQFMTRLLDTHKFDIDAQDKYGYTALHHASKCRKWNSVNYLIDVGANLNLRDETSKPPAYWARRWKEPEILDKMITKGADFTPL